MIEAKIKEIDESASMEEVQIKAKKVVISEKAHLMNVRIEADSLIVGAGTRINDSILLSNGSIEIGKRVQIKENSVLKAFKGVMVGDRTIIDRGVVVGGLQSEHSYFEIGSKCVVLHHSYLNTAREIVIGNNVGIGGYCLIFTHGIWQSAFKGYPYKFGKVIIKDDAWLPWHVFVMPGITIGNGATVAGGSVVTRDVPDYCMVGGVPARIIRQENYPVKMDSNKKNNLMKTVLHDFEGYFKNFLGYSSIRSVDLNDDMMLITGDSGSFIYLKNFESEQIEKIRSYSSKDIELVSFQVPYELKQTYRWIELDSETKSGRLNRVSEEFAQFISRYGVRISDADDCD